MLANQTDFIKYFIKTITCKSMSVFNSNPPLIFGHLLHSFCKTLIDPL